MRIVYLGCYVDDWDRVLDVEFDISDKNTPEECVRRCWEFRYAGVESGNECFCGNTMHNPHESPDTECADLCPGDDSEICGGHWRIRVFTNWVTACGPTPTIANGIATLRKGSNLTYGSIADVYCDPGFIDKPTITCLLNTSWETAACEQIGEEYYITTSTNTWNKVPEDCRLAQPEYEHIYDTGKTFLRRKITLNSSLGHDFWIGYFKAFTEFQYHGCSDLSTSDFRNVSSLVDCHYTCNGSYFGLFFSSNKLKCNCLGKLPAYLTKTNCKTRGDFVCGTSSSQAIYRFTNDKTSGDEHTNTIANMCKASSSNANDSAWVKCDDENNKRHMWCRHATSKVTFVSGSTFATWNAANDICANRSALPSAAVGYTGSSFEYFSFTNMFRNWTLHQENGSISGGPMMFAYVSPNSSEIKFSSIATASKNFLCLGPKLTSTRSISVTSPSNTTTTFQTSGTTYTTRSSSSTITPTLTIKPVTSPITRQSTSTTNVQTIGTTYNSRDTAPTTTKATSHDTATSPKNIQSTTSLTAIDGQSDVSKQQDSKESTTTAVAAGVSVTVAIVVSAVVIVIFLKYKKKLCFANTKRSNLENIDDNHHISLARVESKPDANFQTTGGSVSNHTYISLQNASKCTKDADKYNPVAFTDVTYQNTNITKRSLDLEARAYFVLEKDICEQQRNTDKSIPTDKLDYFVLEKQQPNIGNGNGVSTNEVHPYFVLEKDGDQSVHARLPKEANSYFVLEKQTNGNLTPINADNARDLAHDDGNMYQEIDSHDTYLGIDDSRESDTDYDYTNKAFRNSNMEISENVYNHLNSAGDEYDHVGKGQNNDMAIENNYDFTSDAVRK
ncbi:uncharacterized protein LOC127860144 [Dreissena polymorpha]|uniref:uncharacterized protein LOC127860144 n=1 Tax=Dreissena polymorpha TaxID=45954 RepID=UPI002264A95D|nr:uncharacterized protein LOC127860144 [Dreissena polymorpha]